MKKYIGAGMSGVWDKLHLGHEDLINNAKNDSEKLYIAVIEKPLLYLSVIPNMLKRFDSHFSEIIDPATNRLEEIQNHITSKNINAEIKLFKNDLDAAKWFNQLKKDGKIDVFVTSDKDKSGYTQKILNLVKATKIIDTKNLAEIVYYPSLKNKKGWIYSSTLIRDGKIKKDVTI